MNEQAVRVGITHGDTNGIGYETILKTFEDPRMAEMAVFTVYGSAKAASFYRKSADLPQVAFQRVDSAADAKPNVCNIVNVVPEDLKIDPGMPSKVAGEAALAALKAAVADLKAGNIDVLVTCPIDKHSIQSDTFHFPGHTEFLEAELTDENTPEAESKALMLMCADSLRVALVTAHLPISQVPGAITEKLILTRLEQLDRSLRRDFGIDSPRIAVLSLNPHAGENGLLGEEEEKIIAPAIAKGREMRIKCFGPYPSDGFFGNASYKPFDAVLAMYHDQGLAPFKTLAMDNGVNFTAGLPYVRTSPDHGTGYDIAGKGLARPDSLRAAIYSAIDIYRNRCRYDSACASPMLPTKK